MFGIKDINPPVYYLVAYTIAPDIIYTTTRVRWGGYPFVWEKKNKHLYIWLPRQDQLQEMVEWMIDGKPFKDLLFQVEAIQYFGTINNTNTFTTWEQLWLAFVYNENYNKIWTGEIWDISKN